MAVNHGGKGTGRDSVLDNIHFHYSQHTLQMPPTCLHLTTIVPPHRRRQRRTRMLYLVAHLTTPPPPPPPKNLTTPIRPASSRLRVTDRIRRQLWRQWMVTGSFRSGPWSKVWTTTRRRSAVLLDMWGWYQRRCGFEMVLLPGGDFSTRRPSPSGRGWM